MKIDRLGLQIRSGGSIAAAIVAVARRASFLENVRCLRACVIIDVNLGWRVSDPDDLRLAGTMILRECDRLQSQRGYDDDWRPEANATPAKGSELTRLSINHKLLPVTLLFAVK